MLRLSFCLVAVVLISLVPNISFSQPILQPVLTGLSSSVLVTNAHDGTNRLFIVEQGGRIRVLQPGSISPDLFMDITSRVVSGGERGLLGLTFHPQFSSNRKFYVSYTRTGDGASVIAEYRVTINPNAGDPATERILLVVPQPFTNHKGGMIEFGPDGYLYISFGDGGSANDPDNRAQNINELLGKILRIDINTPPETPYLSPPDNPFFGSIPGRDEIYAYGLRNGWRFSFDRGTGQLWAADVGQDLREEVDIITRGGNYGWRTYEGTLCTNLNPTQCGLPGFISPVTEYAHTGGRCSITGGYVYRGLTGALPEGNYVYADYCTGEIFLWNGTTAQMVLDTAHNISSFGEDESGEIYLVALGGSVWKFVNPNCPLPAPTGLTPSGIVPTAQPTLSWNAVPNALDYVVLLWPLADVVLGKPLPPLVLATTNSYTPPSPLSQSDYAWTVTPHTAMCQVPSFAPVKFFTIGGTCPLGGASVIAPNGAASPTPLFTWSSVPTASIYILTVVNAATSNLQLQTYSASPSYQVGSPPLPPGTYIWGVASYNSSCGIAPPSNLGWFVVP